MPAEDGDQGPAGGRAALLPWLLIAALMGFWLAGMIALRSMLWLPWLSFFAALAYALLMLRSG